MGKKQGGLWGVSASSDVAGVGLVEIFHLPIGVTPGRAEIRKTRTTTATSIIEEFVLFRDGEPVVPDSIESDHVGGTPGAFDTLAEALDYFADLADDNDDGYFAVDA